MTPQYVKFCNGIGVLATPNILLSFNNISILAGNQSDGFGTTVEIPNSTSQSSPKQTRGLIGNIFDRIYPLTGNQQVAQIASIPSVPPSVEPIQGSEFSTDNSEDSHSEDEKSSESGSNLDQTVLLYSDCVSLHS